MKYTKNDKIKAYLEDGYSEKIKNAEVNDLLDWWENLVSKVDKEDDVDEYINNLTVRLAIQEIIEFIEPEEKELFMSDLKKLDDEFISKTQETEKTLWNEDANRKYSSNKEKYWYYFRIPKLLI